jgi:D-amino-acid oxidase
MKVRVVGAGAIGLTSALRLAQSGHAVEVVAAELLDNTTSAVAAALWYPYRAYPEADVTRWSAITYNVLAGLATDSGAGVQLRRGRELFRQPTPDPWWRAAVQGLGRVAADRLPEGYHDGFDLTVPVVDMAIHLRWLIAQLQALGIAVRVDRFRELGEAFSGVDAVVNCTGLGSRELIDDQTLSSIRGQVIVAEQFGLNEWTLDQSNASQVTYVVPRADTVLLGGTADEGDDDLTVRAETIESILQRCIRLVPELARARIVGHHVGLRPGRPAVRLETDITGSGPVVHCYGHGGAGVTLSYGCAEDVVELVSQLD